MPLNVDAQQIDGSAFSRFREHVPQWSSRNLHSANAAKCGSRFEACHAIPIEGVESRIIHEVKRHCSRTVRDTDAQGEVTWPNAAEGFRSSGRRLDVHAAPAAPVEPVGVGKSNGMQRPDVHVEAARGPAQELVGEQILAFLRKGNTERTVQAVKGISLEAVERAYTPAQDRCSKSSKHSVAAARSAEGPKVGVEDLPHRAGRRSGRPPTDQSGRRSPTLPNVGLQTSDPVGQHRSNTVIPESEVHA